MNFPRNTRTDRICPECQGHGGHDVDHPSRDPQLETYQSCPTCGGEGYIRWAATDALETLASERRGILLLKDSAPFLQASARRYYARAKSNACRRVALPGVAA